MWTFINDSRKEKSSDTNPSRIIASSSSTQLLDQIQSLLNELKVKRRALLSVSMMVETGNMNTRKKEIELKFEAYRENNNF